jgi:hypothetical protein
VEAAAADLEVKAPSAVRSGLIYEVQFTVSAHTALEEPTLVLDSGWFDGFTINTMSPDTKDWTQRDGRDQDVVLADGDTPILTLDHEATVFP